MRTTIPAGCSLALLLALVVGCDEATPAPPTERAPAEMGARFAPAGAGRIHGRVVWSGPVPEVPPYRVPPLQFGLIGPRDRLSWDNPQVPRIAPSSNGVGDVVVFLRGVDPAKGRPWDHPFVEVEQADFHLNVRQGEAVSRVGFVRRGDAVTMVSRQAVFHSLHGDGADFFTLAFADRDHPCSRRLQKSGVVELSSAANYFWMRGYLFVAEHPYYARTDRDGRFVLNGVPPGRYEVVCWAPNWIEDHHHRDPESVVITRLYYRPPVERVLSIDVERGGSSAVGFSLSRTDFER